MQKVKPEVAQSIANKIGKIFKKNKIRAILIAKKYGMTRLVQQLQQRL